MAQTTYYVNGTKVAPAVLIGTWSNLSNSIDGNAGTFATNTGSFGEFEAAGTNAPSPGNTIISVVQARAFANVVSGQPLVVAIYDSTFTTLYSGSSVVSSSPNSYSPYVTLTPPAGGWTWAVINDMGAQVESFGLNDQISIVEILVTDNDLATTSWLKA